MFPVGIYFFEELLGLYDLNGISGYFV